MKKKILLKQLEYEMWANNMVITAIGEANEPEERVYEILSHLIISPANWLKRILNESPVYKPWTRLTLGECTELAQANLLN